MTEQIKQPIAFSSRVAKMGQSRKGIKRYILYVPQEKNHLIEELLGKQLTVVLQDISYQPIPENINHDTD